MTIQQVLEFRRKIEFAANKLGDEDALQVVELFHPWDADEDVVKGDRRKDNNADGKLTLYECIQAHHTQASWRPKDTPALWKEVSVEEWPEWIQPHGSEDSYAKDAKVSHNGKHWVSDIDNNIWEPGVYGWSEA